MSKKNEMTRPLAILLDFYGTVVEQSSIPVERMCDEIAEACPEPVDPEEISSYWWRIFRDICLNSYGANFQSDRDIERLCIQKLIVHFGADLDAERATQTLYKHWDKYWLRPAIFPESRDVIARCGVPVCLVSNVDNADLDSVLKHNGLSFDFVVTSEDCRAYKPRPEPFEKALSLLELPNAGVLHVGDSLSCDVRGAKAQGIPALWLNREGRELSADQERPDYVSTNLTGILDIMF
jgi:2-haloalkanoic acid dehalogenase type II